MYDTAAEVFSLGIILCSLVCDKDPEECMNGYRFGTKSEKPYNVDEALVASLASPNCPEGLEALAYQCVDPEPTSRPTTALCLEELEVLLIEAGQEPPLVPPTNSKVGYPSGEGADKDLEKRADLRLPGPPSGCPVEFPLAFQFEEPNEIHHN